MTERKRRRPRKPITVRVIRSDEEIDLHAWARLYVRFILESKGIDPYNGATSADLERLRGEGLLAESVDRQAVQPER